MALPSPVVLHRSQRGLPKTGAEGEDKGWNPGCGAELCSSCGTSRTISHCGCVEGAAIQDVPLQPGDGCRFPASPGLRQHLHLDGSSYELKQPFVTTAAAHSCSPMEKGPFWWSHIGHCSAGVSSPFIPIKMLKDMPDNTKFPCGISLSSLQGQLWQRGGRGRLCPPKSISVSGVTQDREGAAHHPQGLQRDTAPLVCRHGMLWNTKDNLI